MIKIIYKLKDVNLSKISIVGGKAANLGELINLDLNVPNGFVCTDINDNSDLILEQFINLGLDIVAVRSSAICEDGENNSFAGQFETILNVKKENLINSINKCFSSCQSSNVIQYAQEKNVEKEKTKVSVVVQQMIDGECSGVMFTNNPISGEKDVMIEFVKGLGEKLVQGEATPSQVIVDRNSVIKQYLGEKIISEEIIKNLLNIAIKIENHYGIPQDIEWTLKNNCIYILQSRPITSLS